MTELIKLKNISIDFKTIWSKNKISVLKDINCSVNQGDCLGILGESGSGKSTLGKILVGLLKPSQGEYLYKNNNPYTSKIYKKQLASEVSIVFQDYDSSVNPRFTIFEIIAESLVLFDKRNHTSSTKTEQQHRVLALLETVGLPDIHIESYPHQLSGGQLQRVCIARAIALQPQFILFDEAISSLDAHTQVQIMDLLKSLQQQFHLTYIFITHDCTAISYLCNQVIFLQDGTITESIAVSNMGKTQDVYAQKLLNAIVF